MEKGHIVELHRDKEYGMIENGSKEAAHFHKSCLLGVRFDELHEGQIVEFLSHETYNGLLGFNIHFA